MPFQRFWKANQSARDAREAEGNAIILRRKVIADQLLVYKKTSFNVSESPLGTIESSFGIVRSPPPSQRTYFSQHYTKTLAIADL